MVSGKPQESSSKPTESKADHRSGFWSNIKESGKRITEVSNTLIAVSSVVALLWAVILFSVGKNELHLAVWVKTNRVLYPSETTSYQVLPLSYGTGAAKSIAVLEVEIGNYGKAMIGTVDKVWSLTLSMPDSVALLILGDLKRSPETTVAKIGETDRTNMVELKLGALERNARVELQLMVVNFDPRTSPQLTAKPSLGGLPYEDTLESPQDKVRDRLLMLAFWSIMIPYTIVALVTVYKDRAYVLNLPLWKVVSHGIWYLLLIAFTSMIVARGITEVLYRLVIWLT